MRYLGCAFRTSSAEEIIHTVLNESRSPADYIPSREYRRRGSSARRVGRPERWLWSQVYTAQVVAPLSPPHKRLVACVNNNIKWTMAKLIVSPYELLITQLRCRAIRPGRRRCQLHQSTPAPCTGAQVLPSDNLLQIFSWAGRCRYPAPRLQGATQRQAQGEHGPTGDVQFVLAQCCPSEYFTGVPALAQRRVGLCATLGHCCNSRLCRTFQQNRPVESVLQVEG